MKKLCRQSIFGASKLRHRVWAAFAAGRNRLRQWKRALCRTTASWELDIDGGTATSQTRTAPATWCYIADSPTSQYIMVFTDPDENTGTLIDHDAGTLTYVAKDHAQSSVDGDDSATITWHAPESNWSMSCDSEAGNRWITLQSTR